jgi:hypothetical protein
VTPALLSVEPFEVLAAVESLFGLAPVVDPLPASFVDTAPLVGPLPASPFGCANAGADRLSAMAHVSKLLLNGDMGTPRARRFQVCKTFPSVKDVSRSTWLDCAKFQQAA